MVVSGCWCRRSIETSQESCWALIFTQKQPSVLTVTFWTTFPAGNVSQCIKVCLLREKKKGEKNGTCLHHVWEVRGRGVGGARAPLFPSDVMLGLTLQCGGLRTKPTYSRNTTDSPIFYFYIYSLLPSWSPAIKPVWLPSHSKQEMTPHWYHLRKNRLLSSHQPEGLLGEMGKPQTPTTWSSEKGCHSIREGCASLFTNWGRPCGLSVYSEEANRLPCRMWFSHGSAIWSRPKNTSKPQNPF